MSALDRSLPARDGRLIIGRSEAMLDLFKMVIIAVDGRSIDSVARLLSRLDDYGVGDTVRLRVLRGNQEREVAIKLQAGSQ